jgi:hypothetical protein
MAERPQPGARDGFAVAAAHDRCRRATRAWAIITRSEAVDA